MITEAWDAVTGGARPLPSMQVVGAPGALPSELATEDVAVACVSAALMTAAAAQARRTDLVVHARADRAHVAESVTSERRFEVDGRPAGLGFAPLSTFWRAADGWVRTHANYPWHRAALLAAMDVHDDGGSGATQEKLAAAIGERPAQDVEDLVFAHGGVAVRVRDSADWEAGEQGQAVALEALVGRRSLPGASPRRGAGGREPAAGLRVLDLTRTISGPVCTRYLGALGADVLRLDGPQRQDLSPGQVADTLLGKRTAELDFTSREGLRRLHELLEQSDVLVCGYRPGALDKFGLTDDALAERHPGLVVVRLAAWGHSGPWASRRGFDSIVQAATGVSLAEGHDSVPGALPCQLLDHGTGYLAAAAALDGVHQQGTEGGTQVRTLSLARTARWLLGAPSQQQTRDLPRTESRSMARLDSNCGEVRAVAPPGDIDGNPLRWPGRASGFLDDAARWPHEW